MIETVYAEMMSLRMQVEDMEDYCLVDEVCLINLGDTTLDEIITNYIRYGKVSDIDREKLINYYVLYYCEELYYE